MRIALALATVLAASAAGATLPAAAVIPGIPHVQQKPDLCGEACAEMALGVSQDEVLIRSGLTAADGRGCWTRDLHRALLALGVRTPSPWIPLDGSDGEVQRHWRDLKLGLARGTPAIVCMMSDAGPRPSEHFRLLVGYDDRDGTVVYHEPAVASGAYRRMRADLFLSLWPLSNGQGGRFLVRFLLPRDRAAAGLTTQTEGPFTVAGDLSAEELARIRTGTIRWAYERLGRDFFDAVPFRKPLTIYLFRDAASYRAHARKLFGEEPGTPFGYYTARHRALVMNIATGGGTLVHEMVHPMLENDFPGVPSWFNEGLASLFEQCAERDGRITGLVNWRLEGLRSALASGRLGSLDALMRTSREQFYGARSGDNYAQARYLLYWLQEQGLLQAYYRRFRDGADRDPTGREALKAVLGEGELDAIERRWRAFVSGLEV